MESTFRGLQLEYVLKETNVAPKVQGHHAHRWVATAEPTHNTANQTLLCPHSLTHKASWESAMCCRAVCQ